MTAALRRRRRSARARRWLACASSAAALAALTPLAPFAGALPAARAEESDDARARELATELFDHGVAKMERGRCEASPVGDAALCVEACDAFRRAFELYPAGLGALRNLAYVEKALGRVASAARHFRELARRAPLDPRPARQLWADYARAELAVLTPRVPHLIVQLPTPPPPGAVATLDDAVLPSEAWGAALDVDPGAHVVRAQAPGRVVFEERLALSDGDTRTIAVALPQLAPPATSDAPLGPRAQGASWVTPRTLALVTIGVGALTTSVGLGYGVAAISKRKEVCGDQYCDPTGYDEGRSLARRSTVVTGVGLAVLGGGVAWYLLAPASAASAASAAADTRSTTVLPYAGLDGAGVVVVRRF